MEFVVSIQRHTLKMYQREEIRDWRLMHAQIHADFLMFKRAMCRYWELEGFTVNICGECWGHSWKTIIFILVCFAAHKKEPMNTTLTRQVIHKLIALTLVHIFRLRRPAVEDLYKTFTNGCSILRIFNIFSVDQISLRALSLDLHGIRSTRHKFKTQFHRMRWYKYIQMCNFNWVCTITHLTKWLFKWYLS